MKKYGWYRLMSIWLFFSVFIFVFPLYASDKIVKLASIIDYAPLLFQKNAIASIHDEIIPPGADSKILQGYAWDIVRESYHNQGYVVSLTVSPWARAINYMEKHKVDLIISASYTKKRAEKYHYSKEKVNGSPIVIYIAKQSAIDWQGLTSAYGHSVAVIRGFSYGEKFEGAKLIDKKEIGVLEQGFALIDKKRVLGFVGPSLVNDYYLKQHGQMDKYQKSLPFDTIIEFMAGMRNNPRALKLADV